MKISVIVAMSKNRVIGKGNKIPWKLTTDLQYFKRTTMGYPIIMGRKTFESIGKPLQGRSNIIITRNLEYKAENCFVVHSIEEAIKLGLSISSEEIFIIGGGEIYKKSIRMINRLYITEIDTTIKEPAVMFPCFDESKWVLNNKESFNSNDKNPFSYVFKIYDKLN